MSQSRYRITYSKPSETGIKGRTTGSVYFSSDPSLWELGDVALTAQGFTVTITDLATQETKTFNPTN